MAWGKNVDGVHAHLFLMTVFLAKWGEMKLAGYSPPASSDIFQVLDYLSNQRLLFTCTSVA